MSDQARCPACRGPMTLREGGRNDDESEVWLSCDACGWAGCSEAKPWDTSIHDVAESLRKTVGALAYFDPRPRLPTEEEETAHREKHGEEAAWFVRGPLPNGVWEQSSPSALRVWRRYAADGETWHAYPHVDGRPVVGPEGW